MRKTISLRMEVAFTFLTADCNVNSSAKEFEKLILKSIVAARRAKAMEVMPTPRG